jgi:hypothetical protein
VVKDTHCAWFHEIWKLLDDAHQDMKEVWNMNLRCKGEQRTWWQVLKNTTEVEKCQDVAFHYMPQKIPPIPNQDSSSLSLVVPNEEELMINAPHLSLAYLLKRDLKDGLF